MKCLKIIMKNISKLISILFLTFSLLLLIYVFYRSEFYHSGTRFDYYLKYYVFTCVLVILSIISFFIGKETKTKLTIALVSSIFGLYLIEIYFFIDSKQFRIWKSGVQYDTRTKYEIYSDLKKEDPNITAVVGPVHFLKKNNQKIFPLSGVSNRKTILCNENGYFPIYQSDRYGFNNPDDEWHEEEIEFMIAGDSFAHGWCVNQSDTIAGNLRKLTKKRIITLGQNGNGPLIEYASLREYLPLKKTKRVLWIHYEKDDVSGNNLQGLKLELNNEILSNYLKDQKFKQNLHLRQNEVDLIVEDELIKQEKVFQESGRTYKLTRYSLGKFLKLFSLRDLIKVSIHNFSRKSSSRSVQIINPDFKKIIKLAKNFVEQNGSEFYFVYAPENYRYRIKLNNDKTQRLHDYKKVIDYINSLNIPIIDLQQDVFQKHKDPLSLFPWRNDVHYTVDGYKLVSEVIFNKILEYEDTNN